MEALSQILFYCFIALSLSIIVKAIAGQRIDSKQAARKVGRAVETTLENLFNGADHVREVGSSIWDAVSAAQDKVNGRVQDHRHKRAGQQKGKEWEVTMDGGLTLNLWVRGAQITLKHTPAGVTCLASSEGAAKTLTQVEFQELVRELDKRGWLTVGQRVAVQDFFKYAK